MRILFVTHFFPYPPNDGGRLGYFNPIKYLSRANEIVLLSMIARTETQYVSELQPYCAGVETFLKPTQLDTWRLARSCFLDPPGAAAKYVDARFAALVRECIARYEVELVEFQHLNTAVYGDQVAGVPAILREHNVEYKVWQRHAAYAHKFAERLYARRCLPRIRDYEARMARKFARCLTVSKADAAHLLEIAPDARVEAIPSGVDTEYFYPSPEIREEPYRMVLTGSFDWKPKQHNLKVLLTDIMPRIRAKVPQATLYVVGKGVPDDLRRLAERTPGVTVTGTVADVRPYVWQASLVLNYLESGGGIALKALEAMAMKKPILSNSLGCEGIDVQHGREVFLADGADEFSEAAAELLCRVELRRCLIENAAKKIKHVYSWDVIANQLQRCYSDVAAQYGSSVRDQQPRACLAN